MTAGGRHLTGWREGLWRTQQLGEMGKKTALQKKISAFLNGETEALNQDVEHRPENPLRAHGVASSSLTLPKSRGTFLSWAKEAKATLAPVGSPWGPARSAAKLNSRL